MIDWIIAQQGVLCVALLLLIGAEHFYTRKMGVLFTYKLWFFVPVLLVLNNLPFNMMAIPSNNFTRFVVGVKPSVEHMELNVLFSLWAIGVSAISAYVLVHHFSTWRSISKQKAVQTNAYYSSKAITPMLFGFIAPKVLLPYTFKSTFSLSQQALVLEHEQVHRTHKDHWWNTLALCIAIAFWFNPLVWLALRSFRVNQELACDHVVLQNKTQADKLNYAKALVQCAEHCSSTINLYPTFGEKSTMIKRLNLIQKPKTGSKMLGAAALTIAALLTANTTLANVPPPPLKGADAKINEAMPVKRVEPAYPTKAIKENLEGYVVFKFDITETGATDNIEVVKSSPEGVFDKTAMIAFKQWQYKPAIKAGAPVRQKGLLVQLDFKLAPEPLNAEMKVKSKEKLSSSSM